VVPSKIDEGHGGSAAETDSGELEKGRVARQPQPVFANEIGCNYAIDFFLFTSLTLHCAELGNRKSDNQVSRLDLPASTPAMGTCFKLDRNYLLLVLPPRESPASSI
jgi:hypothetical protein